jgi:transcriptional regulator with PAS, ATPase and Fis domain
MQIRIFRKDVAMSTRTPQQDLPGLQPQAQILISFLQQERDPMIVLDPDYNIVAANDAYRRAFAVSGQPFLGQKCYRVSHGYDVPCDRAGEHCPMKKALDKRGPDRVLHIHHTPRGPEHVDVELRPVQDAQGDVVGYVERIAVVRSASASPSAGRMVGRSEAFNRALGALQRVAPSQLPVLLQGESGTGKELFARAVHEASARADGPFVVVDCSGLTETLFESELFGHEKGSFTGATSRKHGLVETAAGGTLFLDEIGDVPLSMQVKLLRLIESGTFRRVGGLETLRADFRLVAATHKPLRKMIAEEKFREDLYYRISAFPIHLPALRERAGDIPLLVDSILRRTETRLGQPRVNEAAMKLLQVYAWPGNIRELRNVLERALLFADDGIIRVEHLPQELQAPVAGVTAWRPIAEGLPATKPASDEALRQAVEEFRGTRRELATHLGLSERTLYRRLKELGLA